MAEVLRPYSKGSRAGLDARDRLHRIMKQLQPIATAAPLQPGGFCADTLKPLNPLLHCCCDEALMSDQKGVVMAALPVWMPFAESVI